MVAEVKKQAEANVKFVPKLKAEIATAQAAADAAKKEDEEATKLLEETRAATTEAAVKAARDYIVEVQKAGAAAVAYAGVRRRLAEQRAEVEAGKAAARAAMPYHAMLLRGQKVIADYAQRAQALAAASGNLKAEGLNLAGSAEQYQHLGQVAQANQIMMTAHSLFNQGDRLGAEAERLTAVAQEVQDLLPVYQQAAQAAAASAAAAANPPALPPVRPLPV